MEIKYIHPHSQMTCESAILGLPLTINALMYRGGSVFAGHSEHKEH